MRSHAFWCTARSEEDEASIPAMVGEQRRIARQGIEPLCCSKPLTSGLYRDQLPPREPRFAGGGVGASLLR